MQNSSEDYNYLSSICKRRKSVRSFSDKVIVESDIDKIIEIAKTSPFASGKKNWEIIAISDKNTLKAIAEQIKEYFANFSSFIKDDFRRDFIEYSKNFTFFESAPVVFFLVYRITPTTSRSLDLNAANGDLIAKVEDWEKENSAKSISCAAMLTLLAAESLGLGACYMTGALLAERDFIHLITNKKDRKIGAIIPIGYY